MPRNDVIEFEDLHGNPDNEGRELEVDLDTDKDPSIRRARLDDEPLPKGKPGADDDFDDLPSNRTDDDRSGERTDKRSGNTFEARLEREREARKRERERAEAAERRAAEAEAQLRKQRKAQTEETVQQLDTQISDVEAQLEAALEAEDTKLQVKLTSKLTDLKARRIAHDYIDRGEEDTDGGDGADGRGSRTPQKNELVDKFTDQHADWFKRPGFERQTRLLYRLDKEVHADGYDPTDPEYFEELNRRLREKAPEVFDDEGGDADDRRGRTRAQDEGRRRSAVAGSDRDVDGRYTSRRGDPNKVKLTPEDFANMRNFGLDPNNPEVIKEYARNKRQAESEGAR